MVQDNSVERRYGRDSKKDWVVDSQAALKDVEELGLSVGQKRVLEAAITKLRQEAHVQTEPGSLLIPPPAFNAFQRRKFPILPLRNILNRLTYCLLYDNLYLTFFCNLRFLLN